MTTALEAGIVFAGVTYHSLEEICLALGAGNLTIVNIQTILNTVLPSSSNPSAIAAAFGRIAALFTATTTS